MLTVLKAFIKCIFPYYLYSFCKILTIMINCIYYYNAYGYLNKVLEQIPPPYINNKTVAVYAQNIVS